MSYEGAVTTKMLATNCVCCGRALVDAISVELGIGPECRDGFNGNMSDENRKMANSLVFQASIAATAGRIEEVREKAEQVKSLGFEELADKMVRRFKKAEVLASVVITQEGNVYKVVTPYRRKEAKEFVEAWREVPGRRWENGFNVVPVSSKGALWTLLKRFFHGKYAKGPLGVFKIPAPEPMMKQGQFEMA
jgi:hypothetical protein